MHIPLLGEADYSLWPPLTNEERERLDEIGSRHTLVVDWNRGPSHLLWEEDRDDTAEYAALFPDLPSFAFVLGRRPRASVLSRREAMGAGHAVVQQVARQREYHEWLVARCVSRPSDTVRESSLPALVARRDALRNAIEEVSKALVDDVFSTLRSALMVWTAEGVRSTMRASQEGASQGLAGTERGEAMAQDLAAEYVVLTARNVWEQGVRGSPVPTLKADNGWLTWFYRRGHPKALRARQPRKRG